MKHTAIVGAAAMLIVAAIPDLCRADVSLGQIIGIAKTIGEVIKGQTTVTPAYALHTWDQRDWGIMPDWDMEYYWYNRSHIQRSTVTGTYLYLRTWSGNFNGEGTTSSTAAFELSGVARENWSCKPWTNFYYGASRTEDFKLAVWVCSIRHTGLWPPSGPYETWVKMNGSRIANRCPVPKTYNREFRHKYSLNDTGTVVGSFGWVDYAYGWPGLCWVGWGYEN